MSNSAYLELLDWRRRVSELFADLRQRPPDAETLAWFRAQKDALFRDHPQSPVPLAERPTFGGLAYWPYEPTARVVARFRPAEDETPPSTAGDVPFRRIGHLEFTFQASQLSLAAFWLEGYAGGLFV